MVRREFNTLTDFMAGVKSCEILKLPYFHGRHDDGNGGSFWVITLQVRDSKYVKDTKE